MLAEPNRAARMEPSPMLSIVVISLLVFVFFKFCLGDESGAHADPLAAVNNIIPTSDDRPASGSKCPPGFVYNTYTRRCKELLLSNKKFADRLLLLMPYFAQHAHAQQ